MSSSAASLFLAAPADLSSMVDGFRAYQRRGDAIRKPRCGRVPLACTAVDVPDQEVAGRARPNPGRRARGVPELPNGKKEKWCGREDSNLHGLPR
jgi:hypothetical protein